MGRNILIVEDEMVVGLELRKTLERLGYGVDQVVTTGEEAVDYVRSNDVDLVLMDVKLEEELDGIEATERIHEFTDQPVVFVTSYSDEALLDRIKRTEALGYIIKPFDRDDLETLMSSLFDEEKPPSDLDGGTLFMRLLGPWIDAVPMYPSRTPPVV